MRAIAIDGFGIAPRLRYDLPEPRPAADELLVRVHASSVNPGDARIAAGQLRWMADYEFPVTPGRDFAGVVEQTGAAVSRYRAGDEVFGFLSHANPTVHDGSWADLITIPEHDSVAPKPATLDMVHAAAAPLAALSAFAALDPLRLGAGETALVIGATGGVGSFVVQLAASLGAHVIAPALPEDQDYLRSLGVAEILDRNADLRASISARHLDGVDAVIDLVTGAPPAALLRAGGRLVSAIGAAGRGPGRFGFNVMGRPRPDRLQRLGVLLETETLRVQVQRRYPLAEAGEALRALATRHTQGKLGILIT